MKRVKFGDVVVRANTKEDKNNTEKEFYLDGQYFEGQELEVEKGSPLKGATIGPMFYFGFKSGQVLFMSRSFAIKKAAVARFDGICSEKTFVLETKDSNILLQEYLVFILQNQLFWDYCEENKSGSVNFFINWSTLERYEFDLPDIEEQKRVSDSLWAAYEVKKSYRKMISSIDEMVKSQFIEMFGRVSDKQPKYPIMKLSECCSYISDGSHFSPEGDSNGSYPMLSVKDMTETGFNYSDCKFIGEKDYNNLVQNGCKPLCGDVLVAKDGSYFKYAFALSDEKEQAILSSIAILRPIQVFISSRYLAYYMLTDAVIQLVEDNYLTGTAIKRVILKGFKEIPIIVPPLDSQNVFVRVLEQADKSKYLS